MSNSAGTHLSISRRKDRPLLQCQRYHAGAEHRDADPFLRRRSFSEKCEGDDDNQGAASIANP
jgi:hypothetical protein